MIGKQKKEISVEGGQILYILSTYEHRRNHGQRAEFRRDPFGEIHARHLALGKPLLKPGKRQ